MPTGQEAMIRAATCPAPALAQVCPDLPELLCRLVDKALSFGRQDRWPSAEVMRAAVADVYRMLAGEELTPSALRSVASRIQISFPPEGASDPCAPTALAPVPSPPVVASPSAGGSQGAYAKGLTGAGPSPSSPPLSFSGWRFAVIAGFCLSVGVIVGILAKRSPPQPLPSYPDAVREAAAPSPPPPPVLLEAPAPSFAPVAPPPSSPPAPPHLRPNASGSPKSTPSPSASASARPSYDDFDHQ
jgi:eukaryotic-like serine/threonine-protein kinase